MIELLSTKKILVGDWESRLSKIKEFSLLENNRIGWNYPLDYLFVDNHFDNRVIKNNLILDIGCGPGAIHGYLEEKYNISIIGIDQKRWNQDYVDIVGNFNDKSLHLKNSWLPNTFDIIFSASSLEHQSPFQHYKSFRNALNLLRPGGLFISTISASNGRTFRMKNPNQYNLSKITLEKIYKSKFGEFELNKISKQYSQIDQITSAYEKRFNTKTPDIFPYVSVGAKLVKKY